jgi:hypothetical protein
LVAKAYDPVGGACLKYKTNRAAEVGRLILGFQELGQVMQNIPPTMKRKEISGDEDRGEAMTVDEPVKKEAKAEATKTEGGGESAKSSGGAKKKKKAKR